MFFGRFNKKIGEIFGSIFKEKFEKGLGCIRKKFGQVLTEFGMILRIFCLKVGKLAIRFSSDSKL